jgi:hypothetical protein
VQLLKIFPKVHGTPRLITVFTRAIRPVSLLSQMEAFHATLSFLRSISILSTHLRLGLSSALSFWLSHQYPMSVPLLRTHATFPADLILLGFNILIKVQVMKLLITQFPPSCHFFSLGSYIFLCTLFSNTLRLCSFLNVRDQVSHPYRTTGKIIVLEIIIFTCLDTRREDQKF